jgi:hypothetical protein
MIALIVGGLAVTSNWESFFRTTNAFLAFVFILGSVLVFSVHTIGRTMFWSSLSNQILKASALPPDPERPKWAYADSTIAFMLSNDADRRVKESKGWETAISREFRKTRIDFLVGSLITLGVFCLAVRLCLCILGVR